MVLYFDDVLVCAESKEKHGEIQNNVIERARKLNIKFNVEKFQFCVNEVKYVGFMFNKSGIKPNKKRIESIVNFKKPNNKK